jgi:hypothetical protein
MAIDGQDETRVFARMPHLDIALIHHGAQGGEGQQLLVALRAVPPFEVFERLVDAGDPLLLWMRLAQTAWMSWLGCLSAAGIPPWITRGE